MTILNAEAIMEWQPVFLILCLSFLGLSILSAIPALLSVAGDFNSTKLSVCTLLIFALSILSCLGMVVAGECTKVESGRYRYEVTLSEDYDISELANCYKVTEQRGKIWVIEEKEEH